MKQHYDYAVYWYLPNDGAKFKCTDCGEYKEYNQVILIQIPKDDSRATICFDCIDDWWLSHAICLGEFKD